MSTTATRGVSPVFFEGLRTRLRGDLALPGEPGYGLARPWNLALTSRPAGVVLAEDVDDVRTAVRWAGAHDLRVAVHATGHGSVGHGCDVLVVHTGRLLECTIDPDRRLARVGAGVVTQRLLDAAHEHSLAPVTGSSGTVGVVGHLSGGGVGPLAATFGAACDHVLALDVVTGDGALHRATPDENRDLFWAMRGGKSALGVITAAQLQLLDAPTIYGGVLYFAAPEVSRVLHEWAQWSADLPDAYTTSLSLTNVPDLPSVPAVIAGRFVAAVRFATPAGRDRAEAVLVPMRQVAPAILDGIRAMPYRDITGALGEGAAPAPIHQEHTLLEALPAQAVDSILDRVGPYSESRLTTVEIRRLGGRLAEPPRHPSAFSHRDSAYSLGVTAVLDGDGSSIVATADHVMTAVAPWARPAIMTNFVDTTDPTRLASAHDATTMARLHELADAHDPAGVFAAHGELPLRRSSLANGDDG